MAELNIVFRLRFAVALTVALGLLLVMQVRDASAAAILASALIETIFFATLAPIMAVAHTAFIGGLAVGRAIGWTAPVRDDHRVPFGAAAQRLWLQTLCGLVLLAWFTVMAPGALGYGLPFFMPLLLAIPFAMVTARTAVGSGLRGLGLAVIPEEVAPPVDLVRLGLPALSSGPRALPSAAD